MATVKLVQKKGKIKEALENLRRRLSRKKLLRVGFIDNSTRYSNGASVPMVAAIQEFGTYNTVFPIPPRPFFRTMVAKNSPEWPKMFAALLEANNMDVELSLNQMGVELVAQLRESIIDLEAPKLSEVTLLLRKDRRQDPDLKIGLRHVIEAVGRVQSGELSGLSGTAAKPLIDPTGEDSGLLLKSVDYEVT